MRREAAFCIIGGWIVKKEKRWLILIGLLVVLGVALLAWSFVGDKEGRSGGDALSPPGGRGREEAAVGPEKVLTDWLQAYADGDFDNCRRLMTEDFIGFFALMGGLEENRKRNISDMGNMIGFDLLEVREAPEDEALLQGEVWITVRHRWERVSPGCSVYRVVPVDEGWLVGGFYAVSVPCPGP